ncbi:MAG TPA: carboxypeptidase regulatory-like domain-containing protein [Kofleriaceae bacterium]|nr:carboxypeptidase regulatory-like domain-containing protein [Kofleriaceae bacterium]
MKLAIAAVALCAAAAGVAHAGGGGTISGTVRWKGAVPARAPLDESSAPQCASTPALSEDLLVEKGRVQDVLVRIENGSAAAAAAAPPTTPAVMTQTGCMYRPRVLGLVEGQPLEIRNADPLFHNVRADHDGKVAWNLAQPVGAPPLVRKDLGHAGDVIDLHCDVHPWMQAWVAIQDSPYFSVTGADGAFTIAGVPPGTYTLEAWHPRLGLSSTTIRVRKGKVTRATFTLHAPAHPSPP